MKPDKTPAGFVADEPEPEISADSAEDKEVAVETEQTKHGEVKKFEVKEDCKIPEEIKKKNEQQRKSDFKEHQKRRLIQAENEYIRELFRGEYYVERCNMMAEQIESGDIAERIDDKRKTMGLMIAEYKRMRRHAIEHLRNAHFTKKEIMADFKLTEADIKAIELSYIEGKIIREEYDEKYDKKKKAGYVPTPDDLEKPI